MSFDAMLKITVSVFILMCYFHYSEAQTINQLKLKYVEMIQECAVHYHVTAEDLDSLKNKEMPASEAVKCLFACTYKKAGMMDDQGSLWVEGVKEMSRKYFADDPATLKKNEDFIEACKEVNDIAVSDGTRGCDRAALIFKCSVEKAPEALTEEELRLELSRAALKCNEAAGIPLTELFKMQANKAPTSTEAKCVLACAQKAIGAMTKDGLYDLDQAYKVAELMRNGDEKRVINAKKMADICVKVNDIKVSDGTKGCERAALIFKCTIENAPKFGFKV